MYQTNSDSKCIRETTTVNIQDNKNINQTRTFILSSCHYVQFLNSSNNYKRNTNI
jgi:hypothetical protein